MRLRLAWSLVLVLVLALSIATAHADINVDSGYITYNTTTQSTFFYYFVESTKTNAPLTLWLQGGPGASSLMGAFTENGPYQYDGDTNTVSENPYSWHQESHMLYLDQPVGTGFSYTEDNSSYPTTLEEVSENVYTFLQLFFEQQPSLVGLDFYIAGESFQGHYGPALASHIMSKNQQLAAQRSIKTAVSIPLQGLFMGDPWIHPYEQTPAYAEYAYATGLIDQCGRNTARGMVEAFQSAVKNENWGLAGNLSDGIQEFVLSSAGHVDIDDIRQGSMIPYIELLMQLGNYLDLPAIQKELNVRQNSTWNSLCEFCSEPLELTVVQSTLPLVAKLLQAQVRVAIYVGNMDMNCNIYGIEESLAALEWPGASGFHCAKRSIWKDDQGLGKVIGNYKSYQNLTQVTIRNAGHELPYFQPKYAQMMFARLLADSF